MTPRGARLSAALSAAPSGFTLLEVLIGFVIAALGLFALYRGGGEALRSVHDSDRYLEAVSRARSHLAALGTYLEPGVRQVIDSAGDDGGGFRWRLQIRPLARIDGIAAPPKVKPSNGQTRFVPATAAYRVEIGISWPEDGRLRELVLDTVRLGAAP